MKIVHVSVFPLRKSGRFVFGIPFKLTQGLTRLGHFVLNFCDRDVAASYLRVRRLGIPYANRQLIRICKELRPDLVLLGHSWLITPQTVRTIREQVKGVRIAQWNCDGLFMPKNFAKLAEYAPLVDMNFVTTAGDYQRQLAEQGGRVGYMPNPVDPSVEDLRVYEKDDVPNDLVFLAGEQTYNNTRGPLCERIRRDVPDLKFDLRGICGRPGAYGAEYFEALGNAKMGLNISARNDVNLYSSDRMAHLMGSGLLTFVDRAAGFEALFGSDELVSYDGEGDLIDKLTYYKRNDRRRREIARKGCERVHRHFNSTLVAQWILDGTFDRRPSRSYAWPTQIMDGTAPRSYRVKAPIERWSDAPGMLAAGANIPNE